MFFLKSRDCSDGLPRYGFGYVFLSENMLFCGYMIQSASCLQAFHTRTVQDKLEDKHTTYN